MRPYLGGVLSAIRLLVLLTWTAPAWCLGVASEGDAARFPETARPWDLSPTSLDEFRPSSVTTPGDELWWDGFGLPSINGQVVCAVEYQGSIIAGGLFEQAGGRLVHNIARWNGSGWEPLGSGMDNWVLTLGVFDGDLIAGGSFQHAGGVAASGIARWDGESWSAMGPGLWFIPNNTNVNALAVDGNTLVAGGYFATSGTTAVKNIARWNGTSWEAIGQGVDLHVLALAVRSGVLYAGGRRGRDRTYPQYLAGGGGLAMWNGVTWESPGGGLQPGCCGADVHSLSVHGDRLIVAGVFGRVGGVLDASNIAGWDGVSWTSVGEGLGGGVNATFSAADGVLYAGGTGLRSWDGSSWNAVPGIDGEVRALHSAGNDLLAAGDFQTSGPGNAKAFCVARYAGGSWHGFDYWTEQMRGLASNGRSPTVLWLTTYGDHLVAGGFFNHAGDPPSWGERDRIAEWDGVRWTTLPPLPAGRLMAATEWNGTLYVSGDFPSGNPVRPFIPVYRLEPNGWMPVGTSAFPPQVKTMAVYQGALHIATRDQNSGYVGAIQRLTGNQWETIGEVTTNGYIVLTSMVEFDGKLVVAGRFKTVDGVAALNVAMWDGSRWEQFGTGLPAPVSSDAVSGLAVHEGSLVATGQISPPGTPPNSIVRWSGSQWDAMGSLTTPFASLGTAYGDLFLIGSTSGLGMRRWDGQDWTPLGSGTQGTVRDVLGHGGYVYMGGSFSRAGGKSSFGMARWGPTTTSVEPTAELAPLAPNPFRSSTSLTYRVPEAGSVRVSVHDVMGREIAVLDRGSKSPGTYGAVWDGKDERGNLAPAGVYFICAELPGADLARKVVRLR